MYQKVSTNLNFVEREKETEKFWREEDIFKKSMENRKDGPTYTFYDGPPTANGKPHIGHVLTRVIKDMIPRYRTMKGCMVPRKAGWDTHGLPVELEEAAYMEGCNIFQLFFKVVMPLCKPSFATIGIFSFLWSYNDLFTQSFFLKTKPEYSVTVLLSLLTSQEGTNYGLMASSVSLIVFPLLIVYLFLQKYIVKGLTAGAVKG